MLAASLALLFACSEDVEATYVQYNGDGDSVQIDVGSPTRYVTDEDGNEVVETASTVLTSSTGSIEVGTGTADPSAGPVGSLHRVVVVIDDAYVSDVDRVAVQTDSGARGSDSYDLERDSAGEGVWVFELESVGEEDETRTDTFTFRLYQAEGSQE